MSQAGEDERIRAILERVRTIAVVGASARPERPSHEVMGFLQRFGYRVIPVNPGLEGQSLLGEKVHASLRDIAGPVDMVDVFRASDKVGQVAADAIAIGAKVLWTQLGVINEPAAEAARRAGLEVVMNRCPRIELARLDVTPIAHRPR